jgi:hypothetical protein
MWMYTSSLLYDMHHLHLHHCNLTVTVILNDRVWCYLAASKKSHNRNAGLSTGQVSESCVTWLLA